MSSYDAPNIYYKKDIEEYNNTYIYSPGSLQWQYIPMFLLLFLSICLSCLRDTNINTDLNTRESLIINNLPVIRILIATNEYCSICLEILNIGDEVNKLNCNHIYHKKCLDKWICNNNCPLCRRIIV